MIINKNIWIVGFGGIAEAIFFKLAEKNEITIVTTKKLDAFENFTKNQTKILEDYTEDSIKSLIEHLTGDNLPDHIIITCGKLYDDYNMPEKSITAFSKDWLYKSVDSNVLPCAFIAKYITPKLKKNSNVTLSCFSARIGSISDNKLGGWHSYRMTKAMLNMLIKNISIEWKIKSPHSLIFGYHPGTTDTSLSKPFQSSAIREDTFSAQEAADCFLSTLGK